MAGAGATKSSSNAATARKRVHASADDSAPAPLKRARDGSAFARCEECNKDVPVALISFHSCSLDAKIKMNLEAQIVEGHSDVKKKPSQKKTEPKAKKEKKAKNPNAPKRPPTAFFIFMDDFRKSHKKENPDCKSVSTVAKEGGEKWKSMTEEEKKPYQDKAAELKAEYEKAMESLDNDEKQDDDEEESSDKDAKETVEAKEE